MPKIRGVKPEYWTDEDIVDLSIPARLLFIGLWSYACDNGHLQDKPKQIKMRVFPGDDVSAAELLRELADSGRIMRVDGWIIVPNFTKHQRPDKRYFQTCEKDGCERPAPDSQPGTRGGHDESTTRPRRAHGVVSMGPHVDGDGEGEMKVMVSGTDTAAAPPASKPKKKPAKPLTADWRPTEDHLVRCRDLGVDPALELAKFRAHAEANDRRQVNWNAAFTQWLLNARPGNVRPLRPSTDDQGRIVLPPLPKGVFEQ